MRVSGTVSTKDNLCDFCSLEFATCPKATHIKFGDGRGNDNVIECSEFCYDGNGGRDLIVGKPELGVFKSGQTANPAA
jgi:hypothetical protein